jgi:NADPH:quinone reductase-like Zn-dependent oxidoreductase
MMNYKRVVVSAFGEPEVLQVVEEELKQPAPGEVLVRVYAAGVARGDCNRRSYDWAGQVPPFTLGFDFAGKVEALGAGVTSFAVGQTVAGINEKLDSYSEYVLVNPNWMVAIPEGTDLAQAACLGLNYLVAYQCLYRVANVKAGEKVLVLGASGGVGTALIELGKLARLEVYGTATTAKIDRIRELGAIPIDYKKEDLAERIKDIQFDTVFDGIFEECLEPAYKHLRARGKYIVFGSTYHPNDYERLVEKVQGWNANHADDKNMIFFMGVAEPYTEELLELANYLATGKINPLVHERIPLAEAARAHQILESGAVTGKIVLMCN